MEIKGTEMDSIEKYLELSRTCPELFAQSEELPLVLDPKELYAFAQKSGRRIGIVYESHYHLMVVDVVRAKNGSLFAYERLMNRVMRGAVVIVPYYNGKYIYCGSIVMLSGNISTVSQEVLEKKEFLQRRMREKNYGKNLVCRQKNGKVSEKLCRTVVQ